MAKCSFCDFNNENGSAYCAKCRTDLGVLVPVMDADERIEGRALAYAGEVIGGDPDAEFAETVRFEKIPLVESLEPDLGPKGELTRPASPKAEVVHVVLPSPALLSAPSSLESAPTLSATPSDALSSAAKPRLVVLRGEKIDLQYPLYSGKNYLGRTDDKPVDIDLENQEPADRIWTSRQHALINFENGSLTIEDLNSLNGTFVNRARVHPGQLRTLQINDIIQVGTVQMRLILV